MSKIKQKNKLFEMAQPNKKLMAVAIFLSATSAIFGLIIPLIIQKVIDGSGSTPSIGMGLIALGVFLLEIAISALSYYLLTWIGLKMVKGLRERMVKKTTAFELSYFQIEKPGELVSRTINDTNLIKEFVGEKIPQLISGIVTLVFTVIILFYMDWQMSILIVISMPLCTLFMLPLGKKLFNISKKTQDKIAGFTADFTQVLSSAELVKASNGEAEMVRQMEDEIESLFTYGKEEGKVNSILQPLMMFVVMGLIMFIVAYGGYRVSQGTLLPGKFIAFMIYIFQIIGPVVSFSTIFSGYQKVKGATERIQELDKVVTEDLTKGRQVVIDGQDIQFVDVTFAYSQEKTILKNVSFIAKQNQTVAFVGPSGSGKSTTFNLIERFYRPSSGQILVGGEDLEEFSLQSWREQIGYVPQASTLLSGTIRDNLTFGLVREVTDEELDVVMSQACGSEIIKRLPKGYDSEVGERGSLLSGGERQRLAIARAFLRQPKLLLLDEATASLDSRSEKVVQQALENLMENRTTFVIAHRLSTVVNADKILFIEQGEVTGEGTHHELLASHDLYKEFCNQQLAE
ncbi:ABC transporter ATP-binding protein [Vagococcus intermedius]|uniref:ABC transporter ATP-binding protein/permease n=1 Tax=Vagococcus intermedius TaxID=2991418 RepID=A0AAF0CW70_9ENTE|nr:ABC transporter ATP-binding protein [Vagococcus intermedius]WEG74003.1 ABC transporter ATP-binding protein/permease [Vagococcus intermedius]WEG76083.1 ABC transporter ATP-binding protein/permease [Vagococcus intermedius]